MKNYDLYQKDIYDALLLKLNLEQLWGKRILVTGATGMVGVCLIDMLMFYSKQNDGTISVVALARNEEKMRRRLKQYFGLTNFSYVIGDINASVPQIQGEVDIIIHAASNSHPVIYAEDPIGTIKTNVIGLDNLLAYAVERKIQRFLFVSSIEVYGESINNKERFEEDDCGYINCNTLRAGYPESKRVGEALCQAYREKYGLDVVIARLSRLYGPTMQPDDSKVISQFIRNAANSGNIVLKSKGETIYVYTYIVDAVSALLTVLTKGTEGEAYNVADMLSEIAIKDLAQMIADYSGTQVVFEEPDEKEKNGYSNIKKSLMSADKLMQLGWQPLTHLQDGITKTIRLEKINGDLGR